MRRPKLCIMLIVYVFCCLQSLTFWFSISLLTSALASFSRCRLLFWHFHLFHCIFCPVSLLCRSCRVVLFVLQQQMSFSRLAALAGRYFRVDPFSHFFFLNAFLSYSGCRFFGVFSLKNARRRTCFVPLVVFRFRFRSASFFVLCAQTYCNF